MHVKTDPLKYQKVFTEIRSTLQSGTYQIGDKLPTEKELATRLGVSRSTIIRALRSFEELGLINRRQGSGSFVTDKAVQPTVARVAMGMLRQVQTGRFADSIADQIQYRLGTLLQQRGAALIVHTIEAGDSPALVAQRLAEQRIGGVFMVPVPSRSEADANLEIVSVFAKAKRPVVLLDGDIVAFPRRSHLDVVGTENRYCGFLQTEHLLKQNLRRILFFGARPTASTITERHLGYLDAMKAYGLDAPPEWTCEIEGEGFDETFVAALFKAHRPEAIVCKSDEFAALLLGHLLRMGIRVPQDVRLVGFDDRPIASLLPVTLTSIRQPIFEIAEAALHLMDNRLNQMNGPPQRVQIAGELVCRQSSMTLSNP